MCAEGSRPARDLLDPGRSTMAAPPVPGASSAIATSPRDGRRGIYVMHADGLNARKLTNNSPSSFVTVVHQAGVDEAVRLWREARTPIPQLVLGDFPA